MEINIDNIKAIFRSEVDPSVDIESLKPDEDFKDYGVDSLDRSSVFLEIEDEFDVTISDKDIDELRTLNKIENYLKKKKS